MARVPSKNCRDQALGFQGFLNNLQDWEMSLNDKDKKLKSRDVDDANLSEGLVKENRRAMMKGSTTDGTRTTRQNDFWRKYDSMRSLSSGFMAEEHTPDAASEKDLGNEYFKQKKFNEAIDCYSRSIALSPTAVAYANRAMAYLKIRRFQEAEDDCTEALSLDDRYIKAYSRRSTARKEIGKLKQSVEDAEFALRLEPHNQEVKKQFTEAKSLYDMGMLKKVSVELTSPAHGGQKDNKSKMELNDHAGVVPSASSNPQKMGVFTFHDDHKKMEMFSFFSSTEALLLNILQGQYKEQELKPSVKELAARAASLAQSEAAKNITPPNSAYQFEVSWRALSGDCNLQACLLKVTSPAALPQIFKNALSAPILMDIIRCIATFFPEEMDLAVKYLEHLAKVPRFDMILMCLSSADKTDLHRIWNEVFCSNATPMEYAERLDRLCSRYCHSS